jgi:hypothetical protein
VAFGGEERTMRFGSRLACASLASLPVAAVVYLLGWLQGDRMVAAGQGWEMAFYWSPLVFMAVDTVLVFGGIVGLVGAAIGPGVGRRVVAAAAGAACVGSFAALPWR